MWVREEIYGRSQEPLDRGRRGFKSGCIGVRVKIGVNCPKAWNSRFKFFRFIFVETATTLKSFQTDKFSVGRTLFPFWGKPQHSARPRISPVTPPVTNYLNYFIVICIIQTILLGISYGNCIEVFVPTIVIFVCSPNICRTKVSNLFLPWWPTLREKFIFLGTYLAWIFPITNQELIVNNSREMWFF